MSVGSLHVHVGQLSLIAVDNESEIDFHPYAQLQVGKEKKTTATHKGTLSPAIMENFLLKVHNPEAVLLVTFWNKQWMKDQYLGVVYVRISDLRDGRPRTDNYTLQSRREYDRLRRLCDQGIPIDMDADDSKDAKPTSYGAALKEEISRGQVRLKLMFNVKEAWYLPPKSSLSKARDAATVQRQLENEGFGQAQDEEDMPPANPSAQRSITASLLSVVSSASASVGLSARKDDDAWTPAVAPGQSLFPPTKEQAKADNVPRAGRSLPGTVQVGKRREDGFVRLDLPWGTLYTQADAKPSCQDPKGNCRIEAQLSQAREQAKSKAAKYSVLKSECKRLQQEVRQTIIEKRTQELKLREQEARELQHSRDKRRLDEANTILSESEAALKLEVAALREEMSRVRSQVEETRFQVEVENEALRTKLTHNQILGQRSRKETKVLRQKWKQTKNGFEFRIKSAFRMSSEEVLINVHPCGNGMVYIFSSYMCIDLFPTVLFGGKDTNHQRLRIPYKVIKALQKRTFVKYVKGSPGGLSVLFGPGKEPVKLSNFVDREACVLDVVSMCGAFGFEVEVS